MNTLAREYMPSREDSFGAFSIALGLRRIREWTGRGFMLLQRWYAIANQRRALSRLTDDQLKDIGISRVDAMQEARKPFWR